MEIPADNTNGGIELKKVSDLSKSGKKPKKEKATKLDLTGFSGIGDQRIYDTISLVKGEGYRVGQAVASVLEKLPAVIDRCIAEELDKTGLLVKSTNSRHSFKKSFELAQKEVKETVDEFLAEYEGEEDEPA